MNEIQENIKMLAGFRDIYVQNDFGKYRDMLQKNCQVLK